MATVQQAEVKPKAKTENRRAENDEAWKHILNEHLKDFVEFFLPEMYQDIDWTRPYENLEQEFLLLGSKNTSVSVILISYLRSI